MGQSLPADRRRSDGASGVICADRPSLANQLLITTVLRSGVVLHTFAGMIDNRLSCGRWMALVLMLTCASASPARARAQSSLGAAVQGAKPVQAPLAPIRWQLEAPRGAKGIATIRAQVEEGWYLYSLTQPAGGPVRTEFAVLAPWRITAAIAGSDPEPYPDRNFNIMSEVHTDSAHFRIPVARDGQAREPLRVTATYQTCTRRYCLPPRTDTLVAGVTIAAGATPRGTLQNSAPTSDIAGAMASAARADSQADSQTSASVAPATTPLLQQGQTTTSISALIAAAVSTALLALLTPCVFPMIPITVGFFGNRTTRAPSAARRDVFVFALGIIAAFVALGAGVSALLGATGVLQLAANPWLNLVIAALFAGFALQLAGIATVALPSALLSRLSRASQSGDGTGTILLMGGTFALTSFTCTAPFVGSLLILASTGSVQQPLVGLLAFSTVFAAPFVVLALAPRAIAKLPRSGPWLDTVKGIAAFAELAAVVKFVSNAGMVWGWSWMTRDVVIVAWLVVLATLLVWLWRSAARTSLGAAPRFVGTFATATLGVWLANGLRGHALGELEAYLPPPLTSGALAYDGTRELPWHLNDWNAVVAEARATQKPILIDFTGYTCTNCRWMEANMFPRPAVRAALARFERARLYTDGRGEPYVSQQALQAQRFGTVALPLYVIVRPDGTTPIAQFLGMTRDESEFLAFLAAAVGAQ